MTNPNNDALQQALQTLSKAASDRRWDMVIDAVDAARAALEALLREDPELPADILFGSDEQELVAGAAANAVDATEMEVAARLLDITRYGADTTSDAQDALVNARTALDALRRNDPELALATLLISHAFGPNAGMLRKRIAEKTAEARPRAPGAADARRARDGNRWGRVRVGLRDETKEV